MPEDTNEIIMAQSQVIGILFEVVKRFQANSDLDEEYFGILTRSEKNPSRVSEILAKRSENSEVIGRLLEQLDS